jgi:hypothetical protein
VAVIPRKGERLLIRTVLTLVCMGLAFVKMVSGLPLSVIVIRLSLRTGAAKK